MDMESLETSVIYTVIYTVIFQKKFKNPVGHLKLPKMQRIRAYRPEDQALNNIGIICFLFLF